MRAGRWTTRPPAVAAQPTKAAASSLTSFAPPQLGQKAFEAGLALAPLAGGPFGRPVFKGRGPARPLASVAPNAPLASHGEEAAS